MTKLPWRTPWNDGKASSGYCFVGHYLEGVAHHLAVSLGRRSLRAELAVADRATDCAL